MCHDFCKWVLGFEPEYDCHVIPKMHCYFFHVEQWINTHKCALGQFSEQAIESLHKTFDEFWERYKVRKFNPNLGQQMEAAVSAFNAMSG